MSLRDGTKLDEKIATGTHIRDVGSYSSALAYQDGIRGAYTNSASGRYKPEGITIKWTAPSAFDRTTSLRVERRCPLEAKATHNRISSSTPHADIMRAQPLRVFNFFENDNVQILFYHRNP